MNDVFDIILKFDRFLVWTTEICNTNRYGINVLNSEIIAMEDRLSYLNDVDWEFSTSKEKGNKLKLNIIFEFNDKYIDFVIDFIEKDTITMIYDNVCEVDKNGVIGDDLTEEFTRYAFEQDNQYMM